MPKKDNNYYEDKYYLFKKALQDLKQASMK